MRQLIVIAAVLLVPSLASAETVTTVDLVRVIDGRIDETLYYYQNNWADHREKAKAQGVISGYRLLIDRESGDSAVLMLVTEYADRNQYAAREANFATIIDAAGGRRLLNDLPPGEFREISDAWTFESLE